MITKYTQVLLDRFCFSLLRIEINSRTRRIEVRQRDSTRKAFLCYQVRILCGNELFELSWCFWESPYKSCLNEMFGKARLYIVGNFLVMIKGSDQVAVFLVFKCCSFLAIKFFLLKVVLKLTKVAKKFAILFPKLGAKVCSLRLVFSLTFGSLKNAVNYSRMLKNINTLKRSWKSTDKYIFRAKSYRISVIECKKWQRLLFVAKNRGAKFD